MATPAATREVLAIGVGSVAVVSPQTIGLCRRAESDMLMSRDETDRWEYETLRPPRGETRKEAEDPKADLNELAAEGWRFVDTIDYTGGGTKYIVFERPVRSNSDGISDDDGSSDAGSNDTDDEDLEGST